MIERLRRPPAGASQEERTRFGRDLLDALDRLGVARGEEFLLASAKDSGVTAGSNRLGPFSRSSSTSRKAAVDNYPRSGSQRWKVLTAIAATGGRTRDELARSLHLPDSSTDARVWELLKGDFIRESEGTRKTQTGSAAKVLVLTDKGDRAVRKNEGEAAVPSPDELASDQLFDAEGAA